MKGDGTIDYIFSFEIPVLSIEIKFIHVFSQACIEGYNLKETYSCLYILFSVSVLYGYLCYFHVKMKNMMLNDKRSWHHVRHSGLQFERNVFKNSEDCVINRKFNVFDVYYNISLVRNIHFQSQNTEYPLNLYF